MLTPEEIVLKLKPCNYQYNKGKNLGEKINYGFIAQDILDQFGSEYNFVCKKENEKFFQVNYYQFIAPMVSVIQKQNKKIQQLQKDIKNLSQEKKC